VKKGRVLRDSVRDVFRDLRVKCHVYPVIFVQINLAKAKLTGQQQTGRKGAVPRDLAPCTGGRFDRGVCARAAPTGVEIPGRAGRRQQSGEILLGKNMESKLPIASLTKLMTRSSRWTLSSTRRSR